MRLDQLVATLLHLRQKVHSYHWAVTGPSFLELHELFGTQYGKLLEYADTFAEHIRTMGEHPPSTLGDILALSAIDDNYIVNEMSWQDMVSDLQDEMAVLAGEVNEMDSTMRGVNNDLDDLHGWLRKQAWFLGSYLL